MKILVFIVSFLFTPLTFGEEQKTIPWKSALKKFSGRNSPSHTRTMNWLSEIKTTHKKGRVPASKSDHEYMLEGIKTCSENATLPDYQRKDWVKKWQTKPGDCQDIRHKVLIRDHKKHRSLSYTDKNKCKVKFGHWEDMFSSRKYLKKSRQAQVTHTVSLRNVHESGGHKWSSDQRTLYVNNIVDRHHHIVVGFQENLQRGGKHPGEYFPKNHMFKCEYLGSWIKIKKDWQLCMKKEEKEAILKLADQCNKDYNRGLWQHWSDDDDDCLSTRNEVLLRDSHVETKVERVIDRNGRRKECRAEMGQWYDPYTYNDSIELVDGERNQPFDMDEELDVDHVVPLKNAHTSGGWAWPAWKKKEYANYLGDKGHLLAVSARENRKKGALGPEDYMPPSRKFKCAYVKVWTKIKSNWKLTMTEREKEAILKTLKECKK
ncbi:MAG: HNH endonuclease [Bacteriovoracaceae bacterium]|nr:HNH endonuclease [Bacteriovoracaceae bacterium]